MRHYTFFLGNNQYNMQVSKPSVPLLQIFDNILELKNSDGELIATIAQYLQYGCYSSVILWGKAVDEQNKTLKTLVLEHAMKHMEDTV